MASKKSRVRVENEQVKPAVQKMKEDVHDTHEIHPISLNIIQHQVSLFRQLHQNLTCNIGSKKHGPMESNQTSCWKVKVYVSTNNSSWSSSKFNQEARGILSLKFGSGFSAFSFPAQTVVIHHSGHPATIWICYLHKQSEDNPFHGTEANNWT